MGILDPAIDQANQVLARKQEAGIQGYDETSTFSSLQEVGKGLTGENIPKYALFTAAHTGDEVIR